LVIRQTIYILLSIIGLVGPWYFNLQFMSQGKDYIAFIDSAFANSASSSFAVDAFIAYFAFAVWAFIEARKIGMRYAVVYVIFGGMVAFSSALPLFLFMRERHLAKSKEEL